MVVRKSRQGISKGKSSETELSRGVQGVTKRVVCLEEDKKAVGMTVR